MGNFDGLKSRSLTRRSVLKGMAGSAAVLGLGTKAAFAAAGDLEPELVFACAGGVQEAMFREMGVSFERATGVKVSYAINTQLGHLAKLQSSRADPDIDVFFATDLTFLGGKANGLYAPIDTSVVDQSVLHPFAVDQAGLGVGCSLSAIAFGYNTRKFEEAGIPAPTSWFDLWDPRLKGRVAVPTFNVTWTHDFLALMARLAGGSEADIDGGLAKVKELKTMGNLAYQPNTPAELENLLTQELAWASVTATGRAYQLQEQGYPFQFVYPTDGSALAPNWLTVIKNSPNQRAAQAFVNHCLGEEVQMIFARGLYGTTNKNVVLPEDLASKVPYGEERLASLVVLDRVTMNENLDKWAEAWSREIERN